MLVYGRPAAAGTGEDDRLPLPQGLGTCLGTGGGLDMVGEDRRVAEDLEQLLRGGAGIHLEALVPYPGMPQVTVLRDGGEALRCGREQEGRLRDEGPEVVV